MGVVLGIHNGHHASCAVVRDGMLVAAIQQERLTRVKNDGQEALSNQLPLRQCLAAAGVTIDEVDLIVSSFQAASPGGTGLHRPLVERGFGLFDPYDTRHLVVSHHYAHGLSALGTSGWVDSAVLVCDLAGSTTVDGADFTLTFGEFEHSLASMVNVAWTRTECLSVYDADITSYRLRYREYCVPHNTPDVFIQNAASLYDNVARMTFGREHAHGQLMALASMAPDAVGTSLVQPHDIVEIDEDGRVSFCNNWQIGVRRSERILDHAPLAAVVQVALQRALLAYARLARSLTCSSRLVAAGGVFLNIPTNSEILDSGLFAEYYVPSAPHDAGISVGCAYAGWRRVASREAITVRERVGDRLGRKYDRAEIDAALCGRLGALTAEVATPAGVAHLLHEGNIVARHAGRAEFGPRALGARSLLASPLLPQSKDRLNAIKRRQPWRPVAPIVLTERCADFFIGPPSPYMTFLHHIRPEHRAALAALAHPDGSTRAQTLEPTADDFLSAVLAEFERLTGFPILVNTSLNGSGEPIVETPQDAVNFFSAHPDVDYLLLEDQLVRRVLPAKVEWRLAEDAIVTIIYPRGAKRIVLIRRGQSLEISERMFQIIDGRRRASGGAGGRMFTGQICREVERELNEAARRGLLVPAQP